MHHHSKSNKSTSPGGAKLTWLSIYWARSSVESRGKLSAIHHPAESFIAVNHRLKSHNPPTERAKTKVQREIYCSIEGWFAEDEDQKESFEQVRPYLKHLKWLCHWIDLSLPFAWTWIDLSEQKNSPTSSNPFQVNLAITRSLDPLPSGSRSLVWKRSCWWCRWCRDRDTRWNLLGHYIRRKEHFSAFTCQYIDNDSNECSLWRPACWHGLESTSSRN